MLIDPFLLAVIQFLLLFEQAVLEPDLLVTLGNEIIQKLDLLLKKSDLLSLRLYEFISK
jgi:hypothetical protein